MLDPTPLTLQGLDFARAEQVRLTVTLGKRIEVRKLRAGSTGSFKAMFPELRYGRCGPSLAVEAVGSRGHRVSWKIVPLECPTRTDS